MSLHPRKDSSLAFEDLPNPSENPSLILNEVAQPKAELVHNLESLGLTAAA